VRAQLIQRAAEMDFAWLGGVTTLGITAGASAPELLVREVVDRLATRFAVEEQEVESAAETMLFKLPRKLVA
jgi:4-hydroxy-3-methylbut-2-enyl diphosphate reductase